MANVRIVVLKPFEVRRDEPTCKPGDVLVLPAAEASSLLKKGVAVLNSDFRIDMIPELKAKQDKAAADSASKEKGKDKAAADSEEQKEKSEDKAGAR